jgi:hypothetical protein
MKSIWRKHLIICLVLGLLAIPIYFLDRALLGGGGGSNWINLDFRGLLFWTYITLIAIQITLSSIAVLLIPKAGTLWIQLGSFVLAVVLLITGVAVYGKLRRASISNEYRALMESRKPLMNVIELKEWWYVPESSDGDPRECARPSIRQVCGRRDRPANGLVRLFDNDFYIDEWTGDPASGFRRRSFHLCIPAKIPDRGPRR